MITLRIAFNHGVYRAAEPTAPEEPEYPPAPERVFQALVASACEQGIDPTPLAALESAPEVWCPIAERIHTGINYVPMSFLKKGSNNGPWDLGERARPEVRVTRPVFVRWKSGPPELRDWLRPVADAVGYLGRPDSPVNLCVVDEPDPDLTHLVPHPDGELMLRAPEPNRLHTLLRAFADCTCPPLLQPTPYTANHALPPSPWGDLYALRIHGGNLVHAASITDMLRSAVMHHAPEPLPRLLHGHDVEHASADHAAWLALPDVGHRHARGALLGVAMLLPRQADPDERQTCTDALGRVTHVGPHPIRRATIREPLPKGLERRTWARPSVRWASVTPMVLDRFPKKGQRLEHLVADGIQRSGFPYPREVELPLTTLEGVPTARRFAGRGPGHRVHVRVRFGEPVRGPLLAGRGRYFGLGLFRPEED